MFLWRASARLGPLYGSVRVVHRVRSNGGIQLQQSSRRQRVGRDRAVPHEQDGYLPAARARELFGADSTMRRLLAVDARNHRFSGGESTCAATLMEALAWVSTSG